VTKALQELDDLAQAVQGEQRGIRSGRNRSRGGRLIVGGIHGHGGVAAVWQTDDEIGMSPAADANDGDLLPTEGVMWMQP
jgi:hypothetical protein